MGQSSVSSGTLHEDPGLGPGLSPPRLSDRTPAGPVATSPGSGFVAVTPRGEDAGSTMTTLVGVYALMWILLLGFVWILARRQAKVDARLTQLERAVLQPKKLQE